MSFKTARLGPSYVRGQLTNHQLFVSRTIKNSIPYELNPIKLSDSPINENLIVC